MEQSSLDNEMDNALLVQQFLKSCLSVWGEHGVPYEFFHHNGAFFITIVEENMVILIRTIDAEHYPAGWMSHEVVSKVELKTDTINELLLAVKKMQKERNRYIKTFLK